MTAPGPRSLPVAGQLPVSSAPPVPAFTPVAVKEPGKDTIPLAAVRETAPVPVTLPPAGPDVTLARPTPVWDTLADGWQEAVSAMDEAGTENPAPEPAPAEPGADHYDAYLRFWDEVNQDGRNFWDAARDSRDAVKARVRMRITDGFHTVAGALAAEPGQAEAIADGIRRRFIEYLTSGDAS